MRSDKPPATGGISWDPMRHSGANCPVPPTPSHDVCQTVQGTRLNDTIPLAAGHKCRGRASEMLETRGDCNDRVLSEVSREPRDPKRPAGDDEERPVGHPRDMWRVRRHDVQDRESVLISRTRRDQGRRRG